jgi:hypothetical protein
MFIVVYLYAINLIYKKWKHSIQIPEEQKKCIALVRNTNSLFVLHPSIL